MADFWAQIAAEPRPYQQRIVGKATRMLLGEHVGKAGTPEPEANSVLIESPTGSGKTVMGLMAALALHRARGYRVGWCAMRRNLLEQAAAENRNRGFGLEIRWMSMFDRNPPPVDLLVVDEAQHDAAASMASLHAASRPTKILGLTATPYRTDRLKLCFERVLADAGIGALIQDGYLSRYVHYTIPDYTPDAVADCWLREPQRWGKSLAFFRTQPDCQAFADRLRAAGVAAEVVDAQSPRRRQLADFEAGRIQVLVGMAILTEGFDCPSLQTVFCRPSGKSCTVQMAGRALRKHPELPRKNIVQCRQTRHPMARTAAPDEQHVWSAEGWKALTLNRHVAQVSENTLKLLALGTPPLPSLVARNRPSRRWRRGGD